MRHHVNDESARMVMWVEWRKLKEWKNGGVSGMEESVQWCWSLDMSIGSVHHNMNNRTSILFHSNKLNVLGASWIQGRVYHQHQHCLWTIAASKVDRWRDNRSKQGTENDYQLNDCREISRESRKRSRNRMSKSRSSANLKVWSGTNMIPGAILRYKITTRLSACHISYYSSDMNLVYCNKDSTSSIVTILETQLDRAFSTTGNFQQNIS